MHVSLLNRNNIYC